MSYGTKVMVGVPFEQALALVVESLQVQGFGVITEIDVTGTLEAKLGQRIEDYRILGACNPALAARALEADRSIGLLLPCNVVVRAVPGGTLVEALDPQVLVRLAAGEDLAALADEVSDRLGAALATVEARGGTTPRVVPRATVGA